METETRETKEEKEKRLLDEYIKTLTPKEYKAYLIAESHLATSFDLGKSNGFLKYQTA